MNKLDEDALVLFRENCKFLEHPPFGAEKNRFRFAVRETLKGFAIGLPCFVSNFPRKVEVVNHPFKFYERQIVKDPTGNTVRCMGISQ